MGKIKKLYEFLIDYDEEISKITGLSREFLTVEDVENYLKDVPEDVSIKCNKNGFMIVQKIFIFSYLNKIYISPSKRGQGISSAWISGLPDPVILECHNKNHKALKLYKNLGFVIVGESMEKDFLWHYRGEEKLQADAIRLASLIDIVRIKKHEVD